MLDPRAVATLGVGYGAPLVARIGLWDIAAPVVPAAPSGGQSLPGRKIGRQRNLQPLPTSRADTWLELRCTVSTSAGLSIHADAAVDAHPAIESVAGLQIAVAADVAQHAAIESTADVNDVLLEILMMA